MPDKPDYVDYFYRTIFKGCGELSQLSAGRTLHTFWIDQADVERFPVLFCVRSLQLILDKQGVYKSYRIDLKPVQQILKQASTILQNTMSAASKVFLLTDGIKRRYYSRLEYAQSAAALNQQQEHPMYPIVGWDSLHNGSYTSICADKTSSSHRYVQGVYRIIPLVVDDS